MSKQDNKSATMTDDARVAKIADRMNHLFSFAQPAVATSKEQEGVNLFLTAPTSPRRVELLNEARQVVADRAWMVGTISVNKHDTAGNSRNVDLETFDLVERVPGTWWSAGCVELPPGSKSTGNEVAKELRDNGVVAIGFEEAEAHASEDSEVRAVYQAIREAPYITKGLENDLFGDGESKVSKPRYNLTEMLILWSQSGGSRSRAQWMNVLNQGMARGGTAPVEQSMEAAFGQPRTV